MKLLTKNPQKKRQMTPRLQPITAELLGVSAPFHTMVNGVCTSGTGQETTKHFRYAAAANASLGRTHSIEALGVFDVFVIPSLPPKNNWPEKPWFSTLIGSIWGLKWHIHAAPREGPPAPQRNSVPRGVFWGQVFVMSRVGRNGPNGRSVVALWVFCN